MLVDTSTTLADTLVSEASRWFGDSVDEDLDVTLPAVVRSVITDAVHG